MKVCIYVAMLKKAKTRVLLLLFFLAANVICSACVILCKWVCMYFYVNVHMFVYVVCTLVWNIFAGINMRSLVKLSISPYIVYVCTHICTYVEM